MWLCVILKKKWQWWWEGGGGRPPPPSSVPTPMGTEHEDVRQRLFWDMWKKMYKFSNISSCCHVLCYVQGNYNSSTPTFVTVPSTLKKRDATWGGYIAQCRIKTHKKWIPLKKMLPTRFTSAVIFLPSTNFFNDDLFFYTSPGGYSICKYYTIVVRNLFLQMGN